MYTTQLNNTHLQLVGSTFLITGMFLDVLGACIAFIAVVQLQTLYALLLRRTKSISAIMDALEKRINPSTTDCGPCQNISLLRHHYQYLEVLFQHFLGNVGAWGYEIIPLQDLAHLASDALRDIDSALLSTVHPYVVEYIKTGDELPDLRSATSFAYAASVAVPLIVGAGVTCFVIGSLCFVKDAFPVEVWIIALVAVFGTLFVFGVVMRSISHTPAPLYVGPSNNRSQ